MKLKKKKGVSRRQLNKAKKAQARVKARASERRKRRVARGSINFPKKYKYKHLSKMVNHNGGLIRWHRIGYSVNLNGCAVIISKCTMVRGEFSMKFLIRVGTRLRRRYTRIKNLLWKRFRWGWPVRSRFGYRRYVRARVSYSIRAVGLRLGKGKGKFAGWRIPLKVNTVLYRVFNLGSQGGFNIIYSTLQRIGKRRLCVSGYVSRKCAYTV